MLDWIPKLRLIYEAVHNLHIWFLGLKCSEHPVPDDEDSSIVLVQTISVCSVMNLVMTRRVEDVVQGSQGPHQLRVDPELVEQVQLLVDDGVAGWDEQGQRKVEWLNRSWLV